MTHIRSPSITAAVGLTFVTLPDETVTDIAESQNLYRNGERSWYFYRHIATDWDPVANPANNSFLTDLFTISRATDRQQRKTADDGEGMMFHKINGRTRKLVSPLRCSCVRAVFQILLQIVIELRTPELCEWAIIFFASTPVQFR